MATYWENSCSFGLRYVSWYKYLIVGLVFSHLGFWSGNLFLIAPFPDLCLLVPFLKVARYLKQESQQLMLKGEMNNFFYKRLTFFTRYYVGCSLILVIDLFSPKPATVPEERYLVVINMFFAILKLPSNFRMKQLIVAICVFKEGHLYETANTYFSQYQ